MQAWSIHHLDPSKRKANQETIRGVAAILMQYPDLDCEVRGETTRANAAPEPLAAGLGLHPTYDVQQIMDRLAEGRAHACMEALVACGVPAEKLFVTFQGRAGKTKVYFTPREKGAGRPSQAVQRPPPMPSKYDVAQRRESPVGDGENAPSRS